MRYAVFCSLAPTAAASLQQLDPGVVRTEARLGERRPHSMGNDQSIPPHRMEVPHNNSNNKTRKQNKYNILPIILHETIIIIT
jgi:hypothetical protein